MTTKKQKYNLPPNNPALIQNSRYPSVHFNSAQTDVTDLPAWIGSWTVKPSQTRWLPGLAFIGTAHLPYPDGEQAIFFSGTSLVGKIRITNGDLSIVDEIFIPGYERESISTADIRRIVKEMHAAGTDESKYLPPFSEYLAKIGQSSETIGNGIYTFMAKDGSYFVGWGTSIYKVADVHRGDVFSPIQIVKSYDIRDGLRPEDATKVNRIFGLQMNHDGTVAIAMPGIVAVMSNTLEDMQYILLEGEAVDNGISVDEKGGIYCVTSKYMRKFTWDGKKLSDREEDGAWKSEYDYVPNPRAFSRGSGNTPTLLGFGPGEDKLVIIADAGEQISIVAMWRDEIPEDFVQKPGTKSRRIADQLPLSIDVPATIEWSPHVYGNGVMMMASAWPDPVRQEDGKVAVFETVLTAGVTREAPVGAEKWSWDSKTHSFKSDWTAKLPLQWALHPVSASSSTVTLTPLEDGVYSLVAIDWDTGEKLGKIVLGDNPIFNTAGGIFIPLNENELFITGVFGPVKITRPAE